MSQSRRWFLEVTEQIFSGMGVQIEPPLNKFIEEAGGLEDQDIFFLQAAYRMAPEPLTPGPYIERGPYTNPEVYQQRLDGSVERGWLEATGEGQYTISAKGKKLTKKFFALAEEVIGGLEPLPAADLERITALLSKVVAQAKELPEPAKKPALSFVGIFDRGPSAPPMMQTRRRIIELRAFRDDVHTAAWQPYGVGGHTWEALTYVWRGEAGTAAELAEQVSTYRGYDEAVYAAALQDLAERGWIAKKDGKYVATEKGKALRQEAEDTTDRYFDAPWVALDQAETEEVKGLLKKLAQAVKPPEEEPAES